MVRLSWCACAVDVERADVDNAMRLSKMLHWPTKRLYSPRAIGNTIKLFCPFAPANVLSPCPASYLCLVKQSLFLAVFQWSRGFFCHAYFAYLPVNCYTFRSTVARSLTLILDMVILKSWYIISMKINRTNSDDFIIKVGVQLWVIQKMNPRNLKGE